MDRRGGDADGCVPAVAGAEAELAQATAINISINAERPIAIFFNISYSLLVIYNSILALFERQALFQIRMQTPFLHYISICHNNSHRRRGWAAGLF